MYLRTLATRVGLLLFLTLTTGSGCHYAIWTHGAQVNLAPEERAVIKITGGETTIVVENLGDGMAWIDVQAGGAQVAKTQLAAQSTFERELTGPITITVEAEPGASSQLRVKAMDATGVEIER